jgi:hypothetical protein
VAAVPELANGGTVTLAVFRTEVLYFGAGVKSLSEANKDYCIGARKTAS